MRSVRDSEFVSMGGKEKELIVVDSGLLKLKDRGQKEGSWRGSELWITHWVMPGSEMWVCFFF